jgi:hypothetical protein
MRFACGARGVGRERPHREVPDVLPDAVLDDGELVLPQVGDRLAGSVRDANVDGHERHRAAEDGHLRLLLPCGPGLDHRAGGDRKDRENRRERPPAESHPEPPPC